jgi:hypothetical protein
LKIAVIIVLVNDMNSSTGNRHERLLGMREISGHGVSKTRPGEPGISRKFKVNIRITIVAFGYQHTHISAGKNVISIIGFSGGTGKTGFWAPCNTAIGGAPSIDF